jgi:hypothetical protein
MQPSEAASPILPGSELATELIRAPPAPGDCEFASDAALPGQLALSFALANAGATITTIMAAITNATVTNNMVRLISAPPFIKDGVISPAS